MKVDFKAKAFVAERGLVPRNYFRKSLEADGIHVVFMNNEESLLEEIRIEKPDILFVQASIVEEFKGQLVDLIKEDEGLGCIYIVIHSSRDEGAVFASKHGADIYLSVPFITAQIDAILRRVLDLPKNVLLISDGLDKDSPFCSDLLANSYNLSLKESGEEVRERVLDSFPDLVLFDTQLKERVADLCVEMKSDPLASHIPCFALQHESDDLLVDTLFEAGIDDILFPPFSSQKNMQKICGVTSLSRRGRRKTALAVDDSSVIRNILTKSFRQNGFVVKSAANGKDALRILEQYTPDVITSDYDMPEMNGWEFCREVRQIERLRYTPLIMLTSRSSENDLKKGRLLGVSAYLTKPFTPEKLQDAVNEALAEVRRQKEKEHISKYVASDAIQNVGDILDGVKERKPESKFITIFFSDICSFTSKCERNSAEKIIEMLNLYFDRMIEVMMENNAIIDKIIGDAIVARFNSGNSHRDALDAVKAALLTLEKLETFNRELQEKVNIEEQINIRIGINSGEVILGNLGSKKCRLDYTMIGDNVNIAQRLESRAPCQGVLVAESTYKLVADQVVVEGPLELVLKGKGKPVAAYQILGLKETSSSES